jgi:hypothetical protein|tara:strand:+ start:1075 stop:1215 length:141 start_codon:yes stop_codon:yes gene_type:complete
MIKNILELLPYAKGETENIKIAKGKYKFPESIKEAYNNFKRDLWQE